MIEPPKNADPASLSPRARLLHDQVMQDMENPPFRAIECVRTAERQAWIWAQGRTTPGPHAGEKGFPALGLIVTQKDGAPGVWPIGHRPMREVGHLRRSNHQEWSPGSGGDAFDAWPVDASGHVHCPPANDPVWIAFAKAIQAHGGRAGLSWGDEDHAEVTGVSS